METIIGQDISTAAQLLRDGQTVGIPTETVYGLAANALDVDAIIQIFETKRRPTFDPLIVHTHNLDALGNYVRHIPETAQKLFAHFAPGPLTVLLPKKDIIPDLVTSGLPRVAVRIPNHPMTLALLRSIDFPLAAPSANPFGYISPTTAEHVAAQLGGYIPYILDGGPCTIGVESTIIGLDDAGHCTVHRLGGLSLDDIRDVVGAVDIQLNTSSNPSAPGMLASHYAPRKKMLLGNIPTLIAKHRHQKIGLLTYQTATYQHITHHEVLSAKGETHEAARNLFAAMRRLDNSDADIILAELLPEQHLGAAINDRLRRAATK